MAQHPRRAARTPVLRTPRYYVPSALPLRTFAARAGVLAISSGADEGLLTCRFSGPATVLQRRLSPDSHRFRCPRRWGRWAVWFHTSFGGVDDGCGRLLRPSMGEASAVLAARGSAALGGGDVDGVRVRCRCHRGRRGAVEAWRWMATHRHHRRDRLGGPSGCMTRGTDLTGVFQQAMFLVAYFWYGLEAV
jgi:hypothetical protein